MLFWLTVIVGTFLTQILSCFRRDRVRRRKRVDREEVWRKSERNVGDTVRGREGE